MNNIQAFAPPRIRHQARRRGSNALRKGRNNADPTAGRDSSILHWIVGERQRNAIEQRRAGRIGFIKFCMMESEWQRIPTARKAGQPTVERQVRGAGIPPTGNTLFTLYSTCVLSLSQNNSSPKIAFPCVTVMPLQMITSGVPMWMWCKFATTIPDRSSCDMVRCCHQTSKNWRLNYPCQQFATVLRKDTTTWEMIHPQVIPPSRQGTYWMRHLHHLPQRLASWGEEWTSKLRRWGKIIRCRPVGSLHFSKILTLTALSVH